MKRKVSIITPLYNSSVYIGGTIQSVINQTYSNWEMLVVDDLSTDDSVDTAFKLSRIDARIKIFKLNKNCGAAVARNTAIEAAHGRYIAFLDSDDLWLPNKLEAQLAFMQKYKVCFSYAAYEKIDEKGGTVGIVTVPDKVSYIDLLKVNSIGCLTAMYDTGKLGKIYMPLIRKRQDLGLWLRILKQIPYAYGMPQVLGQYRLRAGSISANKRSAARYTWRLYRDVEKLNVLSAGYYFSHYAINGVLRSKFPRLAKSLGVLR